MNLRIAVVLLSVVFIQGCNGIEEVNPSDLQGNWSLSVLTFEVKPIAGELQRDSLFYEGTNSTLSFTTDGTYNSMIQGTADLTQDELIAFGSGEYEIDGENVIFIQAIEDDFLRSKFKTRIVANEMTLTLNKASYREFLLNRLSIEEGSLKESEILLTVDRALAAVETFDVRYEFVRT